MRLGISGFNCATGLGYQNRDIAQFLPVVKWLVVRHPTKPELPPVTLAPIEVTGFEPDAGRLRVWLEGIDCLLFYEQPFILNLPKLARASGVAVACIPNWEWLSPTDAWLDDVDIFLCPNLHTFQLLQSWKAASGRDWVICHVPAPVDTRRFQVSYKRSCESFLYVNGNGGCAPYLRGLFRDRPGPKRKGLATLIEAAELCPDAPIFMRSQVSDLPTLPKNITLLPPLDDNSRLYSVGDVAVQPSLLEGTGLQLLEMLSTGMPLITTDAPPMNELPHLELIPAKPLLGKIGDHLVDLHVPDPVSLANAMRNWLHKDISVHSAAARAYVEESHTWESALSSMRSHLPI